MTDAKHDLEIESEIDSEGDELVAWRAHNHRHLVAALADLGARMAAHAGLPADANAQLAAAVERAENNVSWPRADQMSALDRLADALGLSAFERDVVLLCAGSELDASFVELCGQCFGRPIEQPTWNLALTVLPGPSLAAIAPGAALRSRRLIELGSQPTLVGHTLRLDEQILHYLLGGGIDLSLHGPFTLVTHDRVLDRADALRRIAHRIMGAMGEMSGELDALPIVSLFGPDAGRRRAVALDIAGALELNLVEVALVDLPPVGDALDAALDRWERNALITRSALLVSRDDDAGDGAPDARLRRLVARLDEGVVIISERAAVVPAALDRVTLSVEVPPSTSRERRALWQSALGELAGGIEDAVDAVAGQFQLDARGVRTAAMTAVGQRLAEAPDESPGGPELARALWRACRKRSRPRLDALAQRLPVGDGDGDGAPRPASLVLPERERASLEEIVVHVRRSYQVWTRWGFDRNGTRGVGVSALFHGESGTGKTLAAEILAARLELDLYRVDLAALVSKYIGETEKNLRQIFDAADEGGVLLLFDEADALFGKRSDVKDSRDRYANMEVSYLLQRVETARGLSILTTNLRDAIDSAFQRRLRFVVEFPFPGRDSRAEIWRRVFPADTPTEGLDADKLARLNIAGGSIRNIALHGAFLAAEAREPVQMRHLLAAARREFDKLDKPLSQSDIADWVTS